MAKPVSTISFVPGLVGTVTLLGDNSRKKFKLWLEDQENLRKMCSFHLYKSMKIDQSFLKLTFRYGKFTNCCTGKHFFPS